MRPPRIYREASITARNAYWNMVGNICFAIGVGFLTFAGTPLFTEDDTSFAKAVFGIVLALLFWAIACYIQFRKEPEQ